MRRARLKEAGRRAAVITLVAASGATGLGAAFLPDGPLCTAASQAQSRAVELRMQEQPPVTVEATAPWNQPLSFHCFPAGDGVTCCVVAPERR